MPIYKVAQPSSANYDLPRADFAGDGYEDPPAASVGKLSQQYYQAYLTNGDDHEGPEVEPSGSGTKESLIEREIREQRERERELAAMRRLYQQQRELAVDDSFQTQPTVPANDVNDRHHVTKTDQQDGDDDDYVYRSTEPAAAAWSEPAVDEQRREVLPPAPNPEENLILREMIEQQRREEELRQRWKEMGFELYEGHVDEDDEEEGEVFGRGGSASVGNSVELELEAVRTQRRAAFGETNNITVSATTTTTYQQPQQHEYNSTSQHKTALSVNWSEAPLVEPPDQPVPETPRTLAGRRALVLPISDDGGLYSDEPEIVQRQLFEPHTESVIEREIRLAREREEALRQLRGLPARTEDVEERRSRLVEVAVQLRNELHPRSVRRAKSEVIPSAREAVKTDLVDAANDEVFAKRFAESRLKAELQQERQRELDLRRTGVIHTISEERAGDPIRYVDMLDSGAPAPAVPTPTSSAKRQGANKVQQTTVTTAPRPIETAYPARGDVAEAVADASAPQKLQQQQQTELEQRKINDPVEMTANVELPAEKKEVKFEKQQIAETEPIKKQEKKDQNAKPIQKLPAPETRRELPAVLRTYSYPNADLQLVLSPTDVTKLTPEERIEEEVAEFKRREAELRVLRESLRLLPPPLTRGQPSVDGREVVRERPRDSTAFDEDEYLLQVRSRQQQQPDANAERRRLALIEQWERKSVDSAPTSWSSPSAAGAEAAAV